MNLYLRLLWTVLRAFLASERLSPLATDRVRLRVLPNDLDAFGHMNNGRYLTLMDLGRISLIGKTGLGRQMLKHRWYPLVRSVSMSFHRPLLPFAPFAIETRLVTWDDKWFVVEQRFVQAEQTVAIGIVRALIRSAKTKANVPTRDVLASVAHAELPSPSRPPWLDALESAQASIAQRQPAS